MESFDVDMSSLKAPSQIASYECDDCPGTETLTVESLGLGEEEEEVTFAIWEHGDIIRKSASKDNFLKDVRHWVKKAIPHSYISKIQREGIAEAKISAQQTNVLVLHFDFVENWSSKENECAIVKPVVGIQSRHYWLVKNVAYMGCTIKEKIEKVETHGQAKIHYSINDFQVGQFVGCVYNQNWWMGQITGISQELQDITVLFMHPRGPAKGFQWPEESGKKKDECPVPLGNVLLAVRNPTLLGPSARLHTFEKAKLIKIQ
ncbi:hypothetical protein PR048_031851 [Dryococelus australis]|uniref:Uncharacterized protein n=1 Tax=Dryococelus australis TaxID=614101 RepID=A0ABQ9G6G8_9NEOP|nr:hypothetical protein PR048_031851 [Dryococelus australis]